MNAITILDLPQDCLLPIITYLDEVRLSYLAQTCWAFEILTKEKTLWVKGLNPRQIILQTGQDAKTEIFKVVKVFCQFLKNVSLPKNLFEAEQFIFDHKFDLERF